MAQETITEYETVEKQVQISYCDYCGREEDNLIEVAINPQYEIDTKWDVIEVCEEEEEAWQTLKDIKYAGLPTGFREMYGVGEKHSTRSAQAAATIEYCPGCISTHFDIDIPEDEVVDDVKVEEGDIIVNTTKEINQRYPQFKLETNHFTTVFFVLGWPLIFFISLCDMMEEEEFGGEFSGPTYFVLASLGAVAWTTAIFLFILFSPF